MDKILFVSVARNIDSPVDIRQQNFIKSLSNDFDLTVVNYARYMGIFRKKSKILKYTRLLLAKIIKPDIFSILYPFYWWKLKKLLKVNDYHTIIIGTLPRFPIKLSKMIIRRSQAKLIVDLSDPIVDDISLNNLSKSKLKYLNKLESKYIMNFDHLIVVNSEVADHYKRKYLNIKNLHLIEQGTDLITVPKNTTNLNDLKEMKLIYAGFFYRVNREPFELYKAVEDFTNKQIKLSIFSNFDEYFLPPKNEKFHFGGRIRRKLLISKYLESDVLIYIDNKDSIQIPGKLFELLSLNKPILMIYHDENYIPFKYLKNYDGIVYTKNNKLDILYALYNLSVSNFTLERDVSNYSWDFLYNKLKRIIVEG